MKISNPYSRQICSVSVLWAILAYSSSSFAETVEEPVRAETILPELARILEVAESRAPDLVEEDLLRQESDARLKQAKSNYYPSLDLAANFGIRNQYRSGGAEDTSKLGLTYSARLSRPLYHWGAIEARIEQARIDNDTKAINYLQNTQKIRRNLRSDYLTLLLNEISLEHENMRRLTLQNELSRTKADYETGKISELDYSIKELELNSSLLLITKIERDQKRITQRFRTNAGWNAPIPVNQIIPMLPLDSLAVWAKEEAGVEASSWINESYESRLTELNIRDKEESLKIIKARQRPKFNFTASAAQDQSNTSTQNNVDTLTLFTGISVNWNIFDGFETRHRVIEANLERRRLEHRLLRIRQELSEEKQAMIDALKFQIENTRILENRYSLELRNFENSEAEVEAGRLSSQQLRSAELALVELKLTLASARAELLMHISDYLDLTHPSKAL